mgnify:CR=1 FL=1
MWNDCAAQTQSGGRLSVCNLGEQACPAGHTYGPAVRDLRRNLDEARLDNVDPIGGDAGLEFPDTDAEVLTAVIQRYKDIDAWNSSPAMTQESLERRETGMESAGELAHDAWVDFEKLVDNSYAEKAAQNKD